MERLEILENTIDPIFTRIVKNDDKLLEYQIMFLHVGKRAAGTLDLHTFDFFLWGHPKSTIKFHWKKCSIINNGI